MADLTVWAGPINLAQVPGAIIPGSKTVNFGCYGDRDPHCRDVVGQLRAAINQAGGGKVALGAFSAGGSAYKQLLAHADDRARVMAVHLADATYTATTDGAASEGFVLYALDAIDGSKLFIATASDGKNPSVLNPGVIYSSGVQNLQALRDEIEKRSGRKFKRLDNFFDLKRQPTAAYKLGNVYLAEYGGAESIGHGHTSLAPELWKGVVIPFVQGGGASSGGGSSIAPLLVGLGALGGLWWLSRRKAW